MAVLLTNWVRAFCPSTPQKGLASPYPSSAPTLESQALSLT